MKYRTSLTAYASLSFLAVAACSGDTTGVSSPSTALGGSTTAVGGTNTLASGGSDTTSLSQGGGAGGGASGGSGVGGTTSSGGTSAPLGGTTGTGGARSTGGATVAGGTTATVGKEATGGTTTGVGGASATGGGIGSGGHTAIGGIVATGGTKATGGMAAGGTRATGGAIGTGGSTPTGGGTATGGNTTTGGTTATGGTDCGTVADPSKKGPLATKSYTSGLRDGSAYGSQTMHYPTGGNPPYPAIVIVPGFMSAESSIADWGPYFASHGIAVLTIGTNSTMDQPPARAQALLDALETVKAENARSASPLKGSLDLNRLGVMGWSMGGGGTLIVVNGHPELKAAITLCAWNPGQTYGSTKVPTLLFAGTADTLAGGQSQGFYTSIPSSTPKMLFEVQGADHFYANTPAGANGQCGKYGVSWLKVYLAGDECYRKYLLQQPSGTSDFRTNVQ
jgi:dienelactone hydrolase